MPGIDYRAECAANDFAADLLMSRRLVTAASESTPTTAGLATTFEVSEIAMGYHLVNLGLSASGCTRERIWLHSPLHYLSDFQDVDRSQRRSKAKRGGQLRRSRKVEEHRRTPKRASVSELSALRALGSENSVRFTDPRRVPHPAVPAVESSEARFNVTRDARFQQ